MAAPRSLRRPLALAATFLLVATVGGCSAAYYAAMEQLGWEKRDILVNRIEVARDALRAAARRVTTAWQVVERASAAEAGPVAARLRTALADAHTDAAVAERRVAGVAAAGTRLFTSWAQEVADTRDAAQRTRGEEIYARAEERYGRMLAVMQEAVAAMPPVLAVLREQAAALEAAPGAATGAAVRAALAAAADELGVLQLATDRAAAEADAGVQQLALEQDTSWWPW